MVSPHWTGSAIYAPLVLLDVTMPRPDGIETTCRIKHEWPEAKVIVLSSQDPSRLSFRYGPRWVYPWRRECGCLLDGRPFQPGSP